MEERPIRIADLREGDVVAGVLCAAQASTRRTRHGKPYIDFTLRDAAGRVIGGKKWSVEPGEPCACPTLIYVEGKVESFSETLQIRIDTYRPLPGDVADFLPGPHRPRAALAAKARDLIASVQDPALYMLLQRALDETPGFWHAPASATYHGAYPGGLLEHSVNVALLCDATCALYGARVDRDLLIAAALVHDLGKVGLYLDPAPEPVSEERLLGHVLRGLLWVERLAEEVDLDPDRRDHLLHLLASHHGRREWGAAVAPATLEAIVLHQADHLESRVTGYLDVVRAAGPGEAWVYSKMHEGWLRVGNGTALATRAPDDGYEDSPDGWGDPDDAPF